MTLFGPRSLLVSPRNDVGQDQLQSYAVATSLHDSQVFATLLVGLQEICVQVSAGLNVFPSEQLVISRGNAPQGEMAILVGGGRLVQAGLTAVAGFRNQGDESAIETLLFAHDNAVNLPTGRAERQFKGAGLPAAGKAQARFKHVVAAQSGGLEVEALRRAGHSNVADVAGNILEHKRAIGFNRNTCAAHFWVVAWLEHNAQVGEIELPVVLGANAPLQLDARGHNEADAVNV